MTNNVELNIFPDNALDAMALLYVQSQDLAGKTPAEIYGMFRTAQAEISAAHRMELSAK